MHVPPHLEFQVSFTQPKGCQICTIFCPFVFYLLCLTSSRCLPSSFSLSLCLSLSLIDSYEALTKEAVHKSGNDDVCKMSARTTLMCEDPNMTLLDPHCGLPRSQHYCCLIKSGWLPSVLQAQGWVSKNKSGGSHHFFTQSLQGLHSPKPFRQSVICSTHSPSKY